MRENLVAYLAEQIAGSDRWPARRRDELVGALRTRPALYRLLRRTKEGLLRLDQAAIKREARLDGKWLLRTSDETLSAADLAVAYRQLYQVERGWRDLKGALRLRPVFHHREDRIRAHVQLCWLALGSPPSTGGFGRGVRITRGEWVDIVSLQRQGLHLVR